RDHEVDVTDRLEHVPAVVVAEVRLLALARVELVGRETDHEIIPLRLAALQETDMPVVQQNECAVGDDPADRDTYSSHPPIETPMLPVRHLEFISGFSLRSQTNSPDCRVLEP